jgi:hypothetical protein
LEQITQTRPCRRIMRQLSHIFFAEALTFIFGDPASVLDRDVVAKHRESETEFQRCLTPTSWEAPLRSSPSISTTSNCHRKTQPSSDCWRKCRDASVVLAAGAQFTVDSLRARARPTTTGRATLPSDCELKTVDCELFLLSACVQIHRNAVFGVDRIIEDQAQTRNRDEPATIISEPV